MNVRTVVEDRVVIEADSKTEAREKARDTSKWIDFEDSPYIVRGPWPSKSPVLEDE